MILSITRNNNSLNRDYASWPGTVHSTMAYTVYFVLQILMFLPRARMREGVKQYWFCPSVCSQFVSQFVSPVKNFEISTFTGLNNCCTRQ